MGVRLPISQYPQALIYGQENMLILFWKVDLRIRHKLLTTCGLLLLWYFLLPTSSLHCLLLPVLPPPTSLLHYCLVQTVIALLEPGKLLHGVGLLQLTLQGFRGFPGRGAVCSFSESWSLVGQGSVSQSRQGIFTLLKAKSVWSPTTKHVVCATEIAQPLKGLS